jgi:hypothetical protein
MDPTEVKPENVSTPALTARKVFAQLRAAQSYREQKNFAAAKAEYAAIAANTGYLPHHRAEAEEIINEMERVARGLPARDPHASPVTVPRIPEFATEVWVGPTGHAANPGTAARPFATLTQARDAVRHLRKAEAVVVRIQHGVYDLDDTFALTADDSGTATAPAVYRARYPLLKDLDDKPPVNFLWRNLLWNSGIPFTMNPTCSDVLELAVYGEENPGFVDPARGDFRLRPDALPIQRNGFRPIPVEEIGLYNNAFQATWPVNSTPTIVANWRKAERKSSDA